MKKAIALLVTLSFLSVSVFAAPIAAASAMSSVTMPETLSETSLFADVGATALTDEEAMLVEGGLAISAQILRALGSIIGAYLASIETAKAASNNGVVFPSASGYFVTGVGATAGAFVGGAIGYGIGMAIPWF